MSRTSLKERKAENPADSDTLAAGWKTILFNCECHTFHEVAIQLVKAIGCSYEKGRQLANVVHHTGCAIVYSGSRERCRAVAGILEEIGLRAKAEV